jgi:hypothetical protein
MQLLGGGKVMDRRILTYSGKLVDAFDLKPEDICLEDIAHHLALRNRFSGATREPYSVGQHCCLAAMLAKSPLRKDVALLHDSEEAYFPDFPGPWINPDTLWEEAEQERKAARIRIWNKYIPVSGDVPDNQPSYDYHWIDHQLCIAEINFLVYQGGSTNIGQERLDITLPSGWTWEQMFIPWPWQEVERTFMALAAVLGIKD